MNAKQRRVLDQIALPLHGEYHRAVIGDREMANRIFVEGLLQDNFLIEATFQAEVAQSRKHRGQIELGSTSLRMRLNAAVCNRQRLPVRQYLDVMRTNAAGRELAHSPIGVPCVPNAHNASGGFEIILGREEQIAVR